MDTTYGWIECAGLADRSAFDLTKHSEASKVPLVAHEHFEEPQKVEAVEVTPQMKVLGKELKAAGKAVSEHLQALSEDDALALKVRVHHLPPSSLNSKLAFRCSSKTSSVLHTCLAQTSSDVAVMWL